MQSTISRGGLLVQLCRVLAILFSSSDASIHSSRREFSSGSALSRLSGGFKQFNKRKYFSLTLTGLLLSW